MSLFAAYQPERPAQAANSAPSPIIRPASFQDAEEIARISHARNGGMLDETLERITRELTRHREADNHLVLVALVDDEVVGFGRAGYFVRLPEHPPNTAPEGWYLGGVIVTPEHRRRGIGLMLTLQRLEHIAERSHQAFYFANAMNRATIDLHARLGFYELTRDFFYPGVSFTGGVGILYRVEFNAK